MNHPEPGAYIEALIGEMQRMGDPARAAGAKAYMKSSRDFYGVQKGDIDRLARQFWQMFRKLPIDEVIPHIDRLYRSASFDEATLGVCIAREYARAFTVAHLEHPFGDWFDACEGWAHCDELATRAAGVAVHADQAAGVPIIYAWRTRPALWTRRASLLCHFPAIRDKTVPVGILLDTCEALLDEDEFFIRKAVGWTLREFSKGYPEEAFAFLMQHRERASGLTLKEGMRHLPESWQAQIRG